MIFPLFSLRHGSNELDTLLLVPRNHCQARSVLFEPCLKEVAQFHIREASPDGLNWIVIARVPITGPQSGLFGFSFARYGRLRVEFYIDSGNKENNKKLFDKLYLRKNEVQAELAGIPVHLNGNALMTSEYPASPYIFKAPLQISLRN